MGIFRVIVEQATKDKRFRTALAKDPKAAIAKQFGVVLPDDVTVMVHENNAKVMHLVLPELPELGSRRPLTKAELAQVAGKKLAESFATSPCTNTHCRRIA